MKIWLHGGIGMTNIVKDRIKEYAHFLLMHFLHFIIWCKFCKDCFVPPLRSTGPVIIYVSQRGWDHWPGTQERPVYTLQGALNFRWPRMISHSVNIEIGG